MFWKKKRRSAGGQDDAFDLTIDGTILSKMKSAHEKPSDEQYNNAGDNRANDRHFPTMAPIFSLLTNPAFFFGALSGGLLAHFVLRPLIFG